MTATATMDLAVLGLEVRSEGVEDASKRLSEFSGMADAAQKATDRLLASLERLRRNGGDFSFGAGGSDSFLAAAQEAEDYTRAMEDAGNSASRASGSLRVLESALSGQSRALSASRDSLSGLVKEEERWLSQQQRLETARKSGMEALEKRGEYLRESADGADALEERYDELFVSLDQGYADMWDGMLASGASSFSLFTGQFGGFLSGLMRMASSSTVLVRIAGLFGSGSGSGGGMLGGVADLFGGSGGGGGSGGLSGILSSVKSVKSLYDYGSKAWEYANLNWFGGGAGVNAGIPSFGAEGALNIYGLPELAYSAEQLATASNVFNSTVKTLMDSGMTYAQASAQANLASQASMQGGSASGAMAGASSIGAVGSLVTGLASAIATIIMADQKTYKPATGMAGAAGGMAAGWMIGTLINPGFGTMVGAGLGAALGAWLGVQFGGGGPNKAATRIQGLINLTNDQTFLEGSGQDYVAEIQQGKDGFLKEGGSYITYARSNKSDTDLWGMTHDLFNITNSAMDLILTATKDVADIMPDSIKDQWWNSAAMQENVAFGKSWKDKKITTENFQEWGNDLASDIQRQWAKGFSQIDFSKDWEYSGKLIVDQPQVRGNLTQDLVKIVDNMRSTGVEALRDIVNNQDLVDLLHAEIQRTQPEWTKDLYFTGEQRLEMNTPEYIRGVLENELARWDAEIAARRDRSYIDDNGDNIPVAREEEYKDRLTGREIVVSLFDMVRGGLGMNNTGPDFNWLTMDNLSDNLAEIQAADFDTLQAAFDKFMAALSGMAMVESIIDNIENPLAPVSQWVTDAQAAVERMNAHRAEYLEGTGWTDEAIDEVMERYRSAVTGSFMDQINSLLHPLSELQSATKTQIETIDGWLGALNALGATEAQIAEIEGARARVRQSLLDQANSYVLSLSGVDQAARAINAAFDDLVAAMDIAGSSLADVARAEAARNQALSDSYQKLSVPFYDDLRVRAATAAGDDASGLRKDIARRNEREETALKFGQDSPEYAAMLAVQKAEQLKAAADKATAEYESLASSLSAASQAAAGARLSFVKNLLAALDSAANNLKQAVDAWAEGAKSAWVSAAQAYRQALESEISTQSALAGRMGQTRRGLWADSSLVGQDRAYASSMAGLEALYQSALAGDAGAAAELASGAKSFLAASQAVSADSQAYNADFDWVQAMLADLETQAQERADAARSELELLQSQLDEQGKANASLEELKEATLAARASYERAREEQAAAYERWNFGEIATGLESLENAYREAEAEWLGVQATLNEALLAGITTQSELDSLRVTSKLDELKEALLSAQGQSSGPDSALLAALEAARAAMETASQAAAAAAADAQAKIGQSGNYAGSRYQTEYELLAAKAADMNLGRVSPGQAASGWTAAGVKEEILRQGMSVSEWYARYGKPEGFAQGGLASGWALVGEEGPELVNFSEPGRVYTAEETRRMLACPAAGTDGSPEAARAMLAELREQNAELRRVAARLAAIDKNTRSGAESLESLAEDGLALAGTAAVKKTEWAS